MVSASIDVDLDPDLERRLRALATSRSTSLTALLQEAARAYLAQEEVFEREREEDEARYQQYLRSGEAIDHVAVAVWLDSVGTDNPLPPPHRIP